MAALSAPFGLPVDRAVGKRANAHSANQLGRWLKARADEMRAQVREVNELSDKALSVGRNLLSASGALVSASGVGALDLTSLSQEADDASQVSEADWSDITRTLNGDGHAYGRIVSRYQEQITAQMWRLSRQRADCEQLVHEVFVEAYVSLRAYKGRAPFLHWLRRIATRVGYRYWKQQARLRRQSSVPIQDWHRSVEPVNNDTAEQAASIVHSLLAELPPRDRMVLTLIYLEDCSVAEAAELSGWSQTMVKVQAHRARKKLKKLLDDRQLDASVLEE